jgi:uncharacterized membrane protein YfcA
MTVIVLGALAIGMVLGMLGSCGSALCVPILVYLVGHGMKESVAESMAIVGMISIVAAIPYFRKREIDWLSVWYFGLPAMAGTFAGAWLGGLATDVLQLMVFGGVLLLAATVMFKNSKVEAVEDPESDRQPERSSTRIMACQGVTVGIVTGFVGVGGGFLIVPALVLVGKLPIRLAISTSLVIIALNATVGFAKYEHHLMSHNLAVDLNTILIFTVIGIGGTLIGRSVNTKMNPRRLRQAFAVVLIVLGGFLILHEGSKLTPMPSAAQVLTDGQSRR